MNADVWPALLFLIVLAALGFWLAWNLSNVVHLIDGCREGTWWRPMWWARLGSVSLFVGVAAWVWGELSGGLLPEDMCRSVHDERYDREYRETHAEEVHRIFPLHNKCNAHFDMVPAWVNPTVAMCALSTALAVAALLWFAVTPLVRRAVQGRSPENRPG